MREQPAADGDRRPAPGRADAAVVLGACGLVVVVVGRDGDPRWQLARVAVVVVASLLAAAALRGRLGMIGAFVWTWQQAEGVGEHIVGVLQAIVWPAFVVYDLFEALHR